MKIFAWLLGFIAIVGSCVLAANWVHAERGLRTAQGSVELYERSVKAEVLGVQLEAGEDEARFVEAVQQFRKDLAALNIAEASGGSTRRIREAIFYDKERADAARAIVMLKREAGKYAEDPRILEVRQRLLASKASAAVYAHAVSRDERLAYALVVIWLAFGFATAFSVRKV